MVRLTGWHRKHAIRALGWPGGAKKKPSCRRRKRRYGAVIEDALGALWEASDRLCGKRLKVMIPVRRLQQAPLPRRLRTAEWAAIKDKIAVDGALAHHRDKAQQARAFNEVAATQLH